MLVRFRSIATTVAAVAALTAMVSANPAMASVATDPPTTPVKTDIVGVGSDTTQDVIGKEGVTLRKSGYAPNYDAANPQSKLWSYDALGSATIVPAQGCDAITRPNGSSAGINALLADEASGAGCIDFARSSRGKGAADGDLVFVPFAVDGVTWATFPKTPGGTSFNAPGNLSTADLNGIFTCTITNFNQVGGANVTIEPYLPQSSSGTRSFFLSAIGVTTPGACVNQPPTLEENSGAGIPEADRAAAVFPFSISRYIAQSVGVSDDLRAGSKLGKIDGKKPIVDRNKLNTAFAPSFLRNVYNVLKPADQGLRNFKKVFSSTGYICKNPKIAQTFGFAALSSGCGY